MNTMRLLGRAFLLMLATVSIGLWVTVMTLQFTLLNRDTVKGWLANSGAYEHVLDSAINMQSIESGSQSLNQQAMQSAIASTLTPTFIKEVTETGLDAVYDWLEGKSQSLTFSIEVSDKRAVLQQALQTALEPQLKDLPVCNSNLNGLRSQEVECLPPGSDAKAAAAEIAKNAVEGSEFLTAPITEESLGQTGLQYMGWLPQLVQSAGMAMFVLPILALLCGTAYVFLGDQRLASLRSLAGHLFFSTTLGAVVGAAAWLFGNAIKLEQAVQDEATVTLLQNVVQPIIYQAVPAIGFWAMVFAGSIALLCAVVWLVLFILDRRRPKQTEPEPETAAEDKPEVQNVASSPQPAPTPEHVVAPSEPKPPTRTVGRM